MNYRAAYWIGFHPWEDAVRDPPFVAKVAELFEREEEGRQPPYGSALDVGTGFRLVLDSGTFHDFDDARQRVMGRGITAIAAPDATVLLLVWPKRRRPLIRGASRLEVERAFPDWKITHVEPSHFRLPKPMQWLLRPDEHWYRLRRV